MDILPNTAMIQILGGRVFVANVTSGYPRLIWALRPIEETGRFLDIIVTLPS